MDWNSANIKPRDSTEIIAYRIDGAKDVLIVYPGQRYYSYMYDKEILFNLILVWAYFPDIPESKYEKKQSRIHSG